MEITHLTPPIARNCGLHKVLGVEFYRTCHGAEFLDVLFPEVVRVPNDPAPRAGQHWGIARADFLPAVSWCVAGPGSPLLKLHDDLLSLFLQMCSGFETALPPRHRLLQIAICEVNCSRNRSQSTKGHVESPLAHPLPATNGPALAR